MAGYKDKTFCASPKCKNECGRAMSLEDKEHLKELAFRGLKASTMVSWGYFCGEPCQHEWCPSSFLVTHCSKCGESKND